MHPDKTVKMASRKLSDKPPALHLGHREEADLLFRAIAIITFLHTKTIDCLPPICPSRQSQAIMLEKEEQQRNLLARLEKANATQASIETLSKFFVVFRKEAKTAVHLWDVAFGRAPVERKLALIYLANHVLQEGRKKGPEFVNEFFRVLPEAFKYLIKHGDDKTRKSVSRLISVWDERKVFGGNHIKNFRNSVGVHDQPSTSGAQPLPSSSSLPAADVAKLQAGGPLADVFAEVHQLSESSSQWSLKTKNSFRTVGLLIAAALHPATGFALSRPCALVG